MKRRVSIRTILSCISFMGFIYLLVFHNTKNCSTTELRERYLNNLEPLYHITINSEITIDGHIISGYTYSNGNYGIAHFYTLDNGDYRYQGHSKYSSDQILTESILVDSEHYLLFWANQSNLDYALITCKTATEKIEKKLDASNNKILYLKAPSNHFELFTVFFDIQGNRYE